MTLDESNVVEKLVELGFTSREAKLYHALLHTPESTPADLGRISGVPRTRIYETLAQMVKKGQCSERIEGGKKFYRATKPSEVCSQLAESWVSDRKAWERHLKNLERAHHESMRKERERYDKDHLTRKGSADTLFTDLDVIFDASMASDPILEKMEIIRSVGQLNVRFDKLFMESKEILSFTRSPFIADDDESREEMMDMHEEGFKKGLVCKTVYMYENQEMEWLTNFITEAEAKGEEVRIADHLPIKMFIFDRKSVMIYFPSVVGLTSADFITMVVDDPGFTEACVDLFNLYWERGRTFEQFLAHTSKG